MEIYQGLEVGEKVTLGFVRKIQTEFNKKIDKIDWNNMGVDEFARVLIVMVSDANPKMKDVAHKVDAIPIDDFKVVMNNFNTWISRSFPQSDGDESSKVGNLMEQDGKKSISP